MTGSEDVRKELGPWTVVQLLTQHLEMKGK